MMLLAGWQVQRAAAQYSNTTAQEDPAYAQAIQKRVAKIVAPLKLQDQDKAAKVQRVVEQQYFDLNHIYTERDARLKAVKANTGLSKQAGKDSVAAATKQADDEVAALHPQYIGRLNALLGNRQVAEVKDGMTYHTLEVTYKAYTEMVPNLTKAQRTQIMDWLVEAREHAIDAGTSEKKHAWFGKYKGRINNYLSKEGIDMKTAENDWKSRNAAGHQQ